MLLISGINYVFGMITIICLCENKKNTKPIQKKEEWRCLHNYDLLRLIVDIISVSQLETYFFL